MEPLTIVLLSLGLLLAVVGAIMLIVAAFCESIWWGLANLFVPFANLVFVIVHWGKAKMGFCLNLLGVCIAVGGLAASPTVRQALSGGIPTSLAQLTVEKEKGKPQDLNAQIQQKREQIEQWEVQFRQDSVALAQQFQTLQATRTALKTGDNEAIAAFNVQAASYQQKNLALKDLRTKLDTTQQELTTLLDQRSRQATTPGAKSAAGSGKHVVMYTTASCPACKAAKDYMARKGVRYEEHDVEQSPAARQEFDRLGGRGVPLILVGTERMEGFSAQRLDQML